MYFLLMYIRLERDAQSILLLLSVRYCKVLHHIDKKWTSRKTPKFSTSYCHFNCVEKIVHFCYYLCAWAIISNLINRKYAVLLQKHCCPILPCCVANSDNKKLFPWYSKIISIYPSLEIQLAINYISSPSFRGHLLSILSADIQVPFQIPLFISI